MRFAAYLFGVELFVVEFGPLIVDDGEEGPGDVTGVYCEPAEHSTGGLGFAPPGVDPDEGDDE